MSVAYRILYHICALNRLGYLWHILSCCHICYRGGKIGKKTSDALVFEQPLIDVIPTDASESPFLIRSAICIGARLKFGPVGFVGDGPGPTPRLLGFSFLRPSKLVPARHEALFFSRPLLTLCAEVRGVETWVQCGRHWMRHNLPFHGEFDGIGDRDVKIASTPPS